MKTVWTIVIVQKEAAKDMEDVIKTFFHGFSTSLGVKELGVGYGKWFFIVCNL